MSTSAHFLTMTYVNEHLPINPISGTPELSKRDLQLFKKRLRKCQKDPIRYYSVGEYGSITHRPHYHSILFGLSPLVVPKLADIWSLGHIQVGSVTPASIHYVTKYVINKHNDFKGREPPFSLMSRRPGIGVGYLDKLTAWHREDDRMYVVVPGGYKQQIPRYYRDKIWTPFERSLISFQSGVDVNAEKVYLDEIDRLIKLGQNDPHAYYVERLRVNNEIGLKRLNKTDKL